MQVGRLLRDKSMESMGQWDNEKHDIIVPRDVVFDEQPILDGAITILEEEPSVYDEIVVRPAPRQERQRSPTPEESEEEEKMSTVSTVPLEPTSKPRTSEQSTKGKPRKFFHKEFMKPKASPTAKLSRTQYSGE